MSRVKFIQALSSKGGARFEPQEEQELHYLVEIVADSLSTTSKRQVHVIPEMPSPLGIPDFVALVGGDRWLRTRSQSGIPPVLSSSDCEILGALSHSRSLKISTVARRAGWETEDTQLAVDRLIKLGAVVPSNSGTIQLNPDLSPGGRVLAIETKVRAWERAVYQGRTYRTWANNYIVILGEVGPMASGRAIQRISDDGAGLFTQSGWIVKPAQRSPSTAMRIRGFEYLYAAIGSVPSF